MFLISTGRNIDGNFPYTNIKYKLQSNSRSKFCYGKSASTIFQEHNKNIVPPVSNIRKDSNFKFIE